MPDPSKVPPMGAHAPSKPSSERRKGRPTRAEASPKVQMDEATPVSVEQLVEDAIDIFVTKRDGAIGEAAFRYDMTGLYDRATGTPEYYMREGDVGLHQRYAAQCANRINGIETAIVIGQGPGNIFRSKEGEILAKLPRLKRVVTIDIASENNLDAKRFVRGELSQIFGREIEHIGINADFRKAMQERPDLFSADERRGVFCSGSTIMNLPPAILDTFPEKALVQDLQTFADMAGDNGHVLVTYDSNQDEDTIIAPYTTAEAQDLFLNVIDVQAARNPHLKGLSRSHFRYAVDFNKDAHEVRQRLVVVKPYSFTFPFAGKSKIKGVHSVNLHVGEEFHMISSYKPEMKRIMAIAESTGRLTNSIVTQEIHGPTIQLMKASRLVAA